MRAFSVFLLMLATACAPNKPPSDPTAWHDTEPSSKQTVHVAELTLATGLASSGFGGISMGVGKAVGDQGGEVTFWIGIGALGLGVVSTAISLVVFAISGIEYAAGD